MIEFIRLISNLIAKYFMKEIEKGIKLKFNDYFEWDIVPNPGSDYHCQYIWLGQRIRLSAHGTLIYCIPSARQ